MSSPGLEAGFRQPATWLGVLLVLGVLVVAALGFARTTGAAEVVVAVSATVAVLGVAWRWGLSRADLRLDLDRVPSGLRWAGLVLIVAALVYAVLLAVPALRPVLEDDRAATSLPAALLAALVTIPLTTVLLEEVAFRGVLWGLIDRSGGPVAATVWSSIAFGLWHVRAALVFAGSNDVAAGAGPRAAVSVVVVVGTVLLTALAGVVLCEAARRSGSLVAPIGIHWAVNGLGALAAFLASR